MSKVSKEVAFKDVKTYLEKHLKKEFRRKQMPDSKIYEDYEDMIEAVEDGLLIIDSKGKVEYTLRYPLFTDKEDSSLAIKKVNIRGRIKAADKHLLMDGLDVQKKLGTYTLKIIAYITEVQLADVKQLEKEDFDTINQLCSVF